jgi:hypothetical protein
MKLTSSSNSLFHCYSFSDSRLVIEYENYSMVPSMDINVINRRSSRLVIWTGCVILAVLLLVFLLSFIIEGPLRNHMASQINRSLKGYTVTLQELDFQPIGFSITLKDLVIVQDAYPHPPVAYFPEIHAHVHWRAILSGRLVAELDLAKPSIHINLQQLRAEVKSKVPIDERGWQDAVRAVYPLEINRLTIDEGKLEYIDEDPDRPLHLDRIFLEAENIRNVDSPERTYPSPFDFEGRVFETGRLVMKGNANFLAEPHVGAEAQLEVGEVALDYFRPILSRYNFYIENGILSAAGKIEYAPEFKIAHLQTVTVDNFEVDYIHTAQTAQNQEETIEKTKEAAKEASNKPGLLMRIDELHLTGLLGMVNKAKDPSYRIFFDSMNFQLTNLSNQFSQGEARARLEGNLMGSGRTLATASFRPEKEGPDFDLNIKIEGTDLKSMNNLLRGYGNFDVHAGSFSLYSEIRVKNDQIDGYVKPLFKNLDVYDRRQDKEKDLFSKMYEGLVGGMMGLLKNEPREEVATLADLSGEVENPEASTWQIIIKLVENAFLKAILPGFEREVSPDKDDSAQSN